MEEFEGMKRKQLQALCKKHGIPANKSNLEMARLLAATLNKLDEVSSEDSRKLKRVRFSPENDICEYEPSGYKQMGGRRNLRSRQAVIGEECGGGGEGVGVPNMRGKVSLRGVSEPIPKPLKTNFRRKDDHSKAQDFGEVGKSETVEGRIRTTRMRAKREAKASQVAETEIVVVEDGSRLSSLGRNPSRPNLRRNLGENTRLEPTQQVDSRRVTRSSAKIAGDDSVFQNEVGFVLIEDERKRTSVVEESSKVIRRIVSRRNSVVLQKGDAGSEELDVRKETMKRLRSSDVEVVTETDASRGEIEKGSRPVGNLRRFRRKGDAVDELGIGETRLESLLGNPQRRSTRQTSKSKVGPSVNKKTTSREQRGVSSLPIVIENDEPSDNYHGPTMPEVSSDDHLHLSDKNGFTNCDRREGFDNKSNGTLSSGIVNVPAVCSDKERNADASVSLQKTCSPASLNLVGASSGQKASENHGEPVVLNEAEIDRNIVFDDEQKSVVVADSIVEDNVDKCGWSLGCAGFGDVKLVETDLTGSQTQTRSPLSLNAVGAFPDQGISEAERKSFVLSVPELCPAVFAADAKKLVGDEIVDKSSPLDGGSDTEPGQDLHTGSCLNLGGDSADKETSDIASKPLVLSELETGPSVIVGQADQDGNIEVDFDDQTCPIEIAPAFIMDNSVKPQPEFQISTESPKFTKVVGSQQTLEVARDSSVGFNEESKTNFIDDSEKLVTFGIAESDAESRASFAKDRGLAEVELTGTDDVCSLTSPNPSYVYMGPETPKMGREEIDRDTVVDVREKVFTIPTVNHDYDQPRVVECMTIDRNVCSLEDGISSNQEDFAGIEEAPKRSPDFEENVTERVEASCQVDGNLLTPLVETGDQVSEVKSNLLLGEKPFDFFNSGMICAHEPLDEGEIYRSGPEEKGTDEDAKKLVGDEIVDKSSPSDGSSDTKPGQDLHTRSCSKLGGGSAEKETTDIAREPLVLSELETGPNVIVGQADQYGNFELYFNDGTCHLKTAPVCIMDNSVEPQPEEFQIDTDSPTLTKLVGSQHTLEVERDSSVGYNEESKTNFEDDKKKLVTDGIAEGDAEMRAGFARDRRLAEVRVTELETEGCSLMSPNSSDVYLDQETSETGGEEIDHDIVGDNIEKVLTVPTVNHDTDHPRGVVNMTCAINEITAEPNLAEFQTKDPNVFSPEDIISSGNQADFAGVEEGLGRSLSVSARRDLSRESDDDMGDSDEVNRVFSQEFGTCGTEKIHEGVAAIAEWHKEFPQVTRASSAVKEIVTESTEGSCQVDDNLLTPFVETGEQVSDVKSTYLLGKNTFDLSELSGKICAHEPLYEEEIYRSDLEEKGTDEATGACRTREHDGEHQQDSVYKETHMANIIPLASQDEQSGDTSRPLKLEGKIFKLEFKVSKFDDFGPYALSGGVSADCEDSGKNLKEPVHNVLELDAKADALDTDEEMNGLEMDNSAFIPSENLLPIDDLRSMDTCNEDEHYDPAVVPQVTPVEIIELPTPKSSRKEAMKKSSEGELLVDVSYGKTEMSLSTTGMSELITSLPAENKDSELDTFCGLENVEENATIVEPASVHSELDTFCGLENVEENATIVEPASVQVAKEQVEELNYSYIDELIIEEAEELKKQYNVLAKADESQGFFEQQHPSLAVIDESMCYESEFLRQQSNMHDRVDSIQGCQNYEDESLNVENSHAASFEQSVEHDLSSKLNQEKGANLSPKEAVGSNIAVVGDQTTSSGAEIEESNNLVTKQLSSSMIKVFHSDMKENMLKGTKKRKIGTMMTPKTMPNRRALEDLRKN